MQQLATFIIALVLAIAPGLAIFSATQLSTLLIVAAIIPLGILMKHRPKLPSLPVFALYLLLLYALLSCFWSILPDATTRAVMLMLLCTMGYGLMQYIYRYPHTAFIKFTTLGNGAAFIIFSFELLSGGLLSSHINSDIPFHLENLNKGATYLSLSAWVTLTWLIEQRRWWLAALFWALVLGILLRLESLGATVSYGIGSIVFFFVYLFPAKSLKLLIPLTLIGLIAMLGVLDKVQPEAMQQRFPHIPPSALHRLYIWEYTSEKADEHPVLGWGFAAARAIKVVPEDIKNPLYYPMPLHPHNNMLQLRLELGLPGVALFLLVIGLLFYTLHKLNMPATAKAGSAAVLTGYLVIGSVSYSVWHSWWIGNAFLVALGMVPLALPARLRYTEQNSISNEAA